MSRTKRNDFGRYRISWIFILCLPIVMLSISKVHAALWLNLAQVERLKGDVGQAATWSSRAFALNPSNPRIRWHMGAILARLGDNDGAADILLPLTQHLSLNQQMADVLAATLIKAGREEDILQVYELLAPSVRLPRRVAAIVALQYLEQYGQVPAARAVSLLKRALGFYSYLEFQVFVEYLTKPSFWSTETARYVRAALAWRAQEPLPESRSVASKPDRRHVAAMLNIAPEYINFGEELIVNGGFEQLQKHNRDIPEGWLLSPMSTREPFERAVFLIGTDSSQPFRGNRSLRIDGLLIERSLDREAARIGLRHAPIQGRIGVPYVISFVYRTEHTTNSAVELWLPSGQSQRFPATQGYWKQVTIIFWNHEDTTIVPLLRSWSEGSVWFDDFSMRELIINPLVSTPIRDPLVEISDTSQ